MSSEAFVTLATTDGYALGALVLAQSIRQVGTKRNLVVLISNHLSDLLRQTLEVVFDDVIVVEELNSNDNEHLRLLNRPELGITFTKVNCWLLEQYTKCVFLDSDCLVLRQIDDLFQRDELSAAPDAGWPDCFNSGVFVFKPSKDTFNQLMNFASQQNASFDGGDQGLLNGFFSNWRSGDISRHLPFTYNVTANAFYSYLPAVTRFRNDIHIVHFAGALKPWNLTYNSQNEQLSGNLSGQNNIQREFILHWWRIMYQHIWPKLSKSNQSNSNNKSIHGEGENGGEFDSLNYDNLTYNKGIELGSAAHRRAWESGHIDYFGRDSFSNIQQQLERNIAQHQYQYHPSQQHQPTTPGITTTSILKHPNKDLSNQQQTTNISKSILKESTTEQTNVSKTSLKEATPIQQHQSTNLTQKHPSSINSTHLNENKTPIHEHESNWTVKSTILTAYTQGVGDFSGPTVISKSVSETSASTSNISPITTSIKPKQELTESTTKKITGNGTTLHPTTTTTTTNNGKRINK